MNVTKKGGPCLTHLTQSRFGMPCANQQLLAERLAILELGQHDLAPHVLDLVGSLSLEKRGDLVPVGLGVLPSASAMST